MADVTKDITKRMNFFDRQFLRAKDFRDEQDYHIDRRWRHNRLLHKPGVVSSTDLKVTKNSPKTVVVSKGTAIDGLGRELVLASDSLPISIPPIFSNKMDIVISYVETSTDNSTDPGISGPTRIEEKPNIEIVLPGNYPANAVPLAQVQVGVNGEIVSPIIESGVRMLAGLNLTYLTLVGLEVEELKVKAPSPLNSSDWPMFNCINSKEVTLDGTLKATSFIGDGSKITLVEKLNGKFVCGIAILDPNDPNYDPINGNISIVTSQNMDGKLILARGWATIGSASPGLISTGSSGVIDNNSVKECWLINKSASLAELVIFEQMEGSSPNEVILQVKLKVSSTGINMIITTKNPVLTTKKIGYSFQISWQ